MTDTSTPPDRANTDGGEEHSATDAGRLVAVGLGPGHPEGMTERAHEALLAADHVVGYETYVDLLPEAVIDAAEEVHATGMGGEIPRTESAVDRALDGHDVALVGSGDPNVYALGGLVLEVLESRGLDPDTVDFEVVPGVTAAQASAARLGAPLVNDAVSISLSDHLTTQAEIFSRLEAVAPEGFAIAIYNPWSPNRAEIFERACEILAEHRPPDTPVGIVRGAGRENEATEILTLSDLPSMGDSSLLDMTATVVVGTDQTRVYGDRMITPRGYERKYDY